MDGNARPEPPIERAQRVARAHNLEALRKPFRGEQGEQSIAETPALFARIANYTLAQFSVALRLGLRAVTDDDVGALATAAS